MNPCNRNRIRLVPVLLLVLSSAASAQTRPAPPVDPTALVRRAVANRLAEEAAHRPLRFVLHKKDPRRDFTQKIIETPQGDVAMAVAAFGVPLSPAAHQAQVDRLNNLLADPALQQHRLRHEQADAARIDKLLRLLPDAFLYRYVSTVPCTVTVPPDVPLLGKLPRPTPVAAPTSHCYHLTFTPNPRFDPPDTGSRLLLGMAGDVWIDQSAERLHRLNAHLIADVDFGWGIIGRLYRGGTVFLEQDDVGGGEWELTRMKLNLTGKALMVKSLSFRIQEEMGRFAPVPPGIDYRQAIHILLSEPVPTAP